MISNIQFHTKIILFFNCEDQSFAFSKGKKIEREKEIALFNFKLFLQYSRRYNTVKNKNEIWSYLFLRGSRISLSKWCYSKTPLGTRKITDTLLSPQAQKVHSSSKTEALVRQVTNISIIQPLPTIAPLSRQYNPQYTRKFSDAWDRT